MIFGTKAFADVNLPSEQAWYSAATPKPNIYSEAGCVRARARSANVTASVRVAVGARRGWRWGYVEGGGGGT